MAKSTDNLINIFQNSLGLNKVRAKFLFLFVQAMICARSVNLVKIASVIDSKAKKLSIFRRLQRFVGLIEIPQGLLAKMQVRILRIDEEKWTLSMDRTNWKIGKTYINILYLCICRGSMGIPIFWIFLPTKKCGNSDHFDRIFIMDKFIATFSIDKIKVLLMDREFIGPKWIADYLEANKIPYVVRLKESGYIKNARGKLVKMNTLFRSLKEEEIKNIGKRSIGKTAKNQVHSVSASRYKNELLVVAHSEIITNSIEFYKKRWDIEVMFKAFKKNGFNLEDTRITEMQRLETLTSVMAIAFCIAYKKGCDVEEKEGFLKKSTAIDRCQFLDKVLI